ncbi:MAG: hypothetical protein WCD79_16750 [Chthoniobacteraceae bacterium]
MKHIVALFALLFAVTAFADDAAPAISAHQALDAAEKNMNERGIGKQVFIESVTLKKDAAFSAEPAYWFVKWSHSIPATDPHKVEIGIKVRMDGRTTRLVKGRNEP